MTSRNITCPHFTPMAGSHRCGNYIRNGSCQRPGEFMCVEWLRVTQGTEPTRVAKPEVPKPAERDLFGTPIERPTPKAVPTTKPHAAANPPNAVVTPCRPNSTRLPMLGETPLIRSVTEADVASFKAAHIEACIENEQLGPVWIVPEYTDQSRRELTVEHAMVLAAVGAVFPDARVTALRRPSERQPEKSTGQ